MGIKLKTLRAVRDGKGIETRAFNVTTGKTIDIILEDGMVRDKKTKQWRQVTTPKVFLIDDGMHQVINLDKYDVYYYEIADEEH